MEQKILKVGDVIEFNGKKYRAESEAESGSCRGCAFDDATSCPIKSEDCSATSLIFKEVKETPRRHIELGVLNVEGDKVTFRIVEQTHHVRNRSHAADMAEELGAQSLPLARPLDQTGDVDELQRGGHDPPGVFQIGQHLQPLVRHRHNAGIRLNRTEGEVRGFRAAFAQRVEQRGFAHIRQTDKTTGKAHSLTQSK